MSRARKFLGHPFWQAILLTIAAYLVFSLGIPYVPPLIGLRSAPVPQSVVLQYLLSAMVGILIYVSANEERWERFKEPIQTTLVSPRRRVLRGALLVISPVVVGLAVFNAVRPTVSAPIQLRSIHPAPPGQITYRGKAIQLTGLENPLRSTGNLQEHYQVGRRVYVQNCMHCHGDQLSGDGRWASAFSPAPLSFNDPGTISQLTESFVFWRIVKGGIGLPREGAPWNSAMPAWEDFLTEDEIWSVIIYLYEQTGRQPRTWEASAEHD